jgi:quinol monooxygenase YgiN
MTAAISWNLRATVKDGSLEDFRVLMEEMVESTLNESGTLMYEWFLGEDGSSCHIYERYSDSDAVMTHVGTFGANFAERFLALAEVTELSVYGDPSDEVRAALAGMGASFLGTLGGFSR